jgi:hypothetical protein
LTRHLGVLLVLLLGLLFRCVTIRLSLGLSVRTLGLFLCGFNVSLGLFSLGRRSSLGFGLGRLGLGLDVAVLGFGVTVTVGGIVGTALRRVDEFGPLNVSWS